jgi:hypothetical protein
MFTSPSRWLRCVLVFGIGVSGCAETTLTYTPLNVPPHDLKAKRPEQMQVFSSAPPERPHVDVGLLTVQEGAGGTETPASLIEALRQTGAEQGCDALMLAPPTSTIRPPGLAYLDHPLQVYSATCIVYRTTEPGDASVTFVPASSSATVVDPPLPLQPNPDRRRMCRDRRDFEASRNCVLDTKQH